MSDYKCASTDVSADFRSDVDIATTMSPQSLQQAIHDKHVGPLHAITFLWMLVSYLSLRILEKIKSLTSTWKSSHLEAYLYILPLATIKSVIAPEVSPVYVDDTDIIYV